MVAIMNMYSRHVLNWKLSTKLDTEFCLDSLEMALSSGLKPEIFHSDQDCLFTSGNFVAQLHAETVKISWTWRKRWYGNSWFKRLWRTHKEEKEVYLRAYGDRWEADIIFDHFA